jgi:signal transduction histidine kinase
MQPNIPGPGEGGTTPRPRPAGSGFARREGAGRSAEPGEGPQARAGLEEEVARLRGQVAELTKQRDRAGAALRGVGRVLPAAIWLAHDTRCAVVTGNPEALLQFGLGPGDDGVGPEAEELTLDFSPGSPAHTAFPFFHDGRRVTREDYPLVRAAEQGEDVQGYLMDFTTRGGEARTISVSSRPLLDRDGVRVGAVAVSMDVTELCEKERRAYANEQRLMALVEASDALLCVTDERLAITERLPAWENFTQQPFESYREFGWQAALHPDDVERVKGAVGAAYEGGVFEARYRLWKGVPGVPFSPGVPGAGEWRHMEDTSAPVRDSTGVIREWVGWVEDRTVRHEAEEALAEHARALARSNADLEEFAHVAAHDLKEPLRGLRLLASFIEEDAGPVLSGENRQRLQKLQALCGRMQTLMDSLLESARLTSEPIRPQTTTLAEPVRAAMALLSGRVAQEGAQVEVDEEVMTACVKCDPQRVAQVLANLIGNGLKYNSAPVKRVRVGVMGHGGVAGAGVEGKPCPPSADAAPMVTVFVKDNGIGISPEQAGLVFKMFRRLHGRDEFGGGAGAGLAIARKIVERHGGTMWIESEPGVGSTFFFTLPAR